MACLEACDVGCGSARDAVWLAKRGGQVGPCMMPQPRHRQQDSRRRTAYTASQMWEEEDGDEPSPSLPSWVLRWRWNTRGLRPLLLLAFVCPCVCVSGCWRVRGVDRLARCVERGRSLARRHGVQDRVELETAVIKGGQVREGGMEEQQAYKHRCCVDDGSWGGSSSSTSSISSFSVCWRGPLWWWWPWWWLLLLP